MKKNEQKNAVQKLKDENWNINYQGYLVYPFSFVFKSQWHTLTFILIK